MSLRAKAAEPKGREDRAQGGQGRYSGARARSMSNCSAVIPALRHAGAAEARLTITLIDNPRRYFSRFNLQPAPQANAVRCPGPTAGSGEHTAFVASAGGASVRFCRLGFRRPAGRAL